MEVGSISSSVRGPGVRLTALTPLTEQQKGFGRNGLKKMLACERVPLTPCTACTALTEQ